MEVDRLSLQIISPGHTCTVHVRVYAINITIDLDIFIMCGNLFIFISGAHHQLKLTCLLLSVEKLSLLLL